MAKPLRSQLNQVRAWVRQGRTDAWIAHQLEVSTSELREFRRRHELDAEDDAEEGDLRDEIEAEIEAATREEELAAEAASDDDEEAVEEEEDDGDRNGGPADERDLARGGPARERDAARDGEGEGDRPPRRRRRRRGGRGRRPGAGMQASFDHGEDGYGLWLDPAIVDDPIYAEHWAEHRRVEVTVEPDRIVIRRSEPGAESDSGSESGSDSGAESSSRPDSGSDADSE